MPGEAPPPTPAITATLAAARNRRLSLRMPAAPAPPRKCNEATRSFSIFFILQCPTYAVGRSALAKLCFWRDSSRSIDADAQAMQRLTPHDQAHSGGQALNRSSLKSI